MSYFINYHGNWLIICWSSIEQGYRIFFLPTVFAETIIPTLSLGYWVWYIYLLKYKGWNVHATKYVTFAIFCSFHKSPSPSKVRSLNIHPTERSVTHRLICNHLQPIKTKLFSRSRLSSRTQAHLWRPCLQQGYNRVSNACPSTPWITLTSVLAGS